MAGRVDRGATINLSIRAASAAPSLLRADVVTPADAAHPESDQGDARRLRAFWTCRFGEMRLRTRQLMLLGKRDAGMTNAHELNKFGDKQRGLRAWTLGDWPALDALA